MMYLPAGTSTWVKETVSCVQLRDASVRTVCVAASSSVHGALDGYHLEAVEGDVVTGELPRLGVRPGGVVGVTDGGVGEAAHTTLDRDAPGQRTGVEGVRA